ncbi:MAG: FAD-binding oxidoreductase [Anaerolineales bacterium]|nr:FAD-binding oxidoreductase [Anaerolineales bacterium]
MKTTPFWTDDTPRPEDLPRAALPPETDVLIIGAGYTGLAAARVLARAGYRTAVLEQYTVGWGASGRNGGIVTTGLRRPLPDVVKEHGVDVGRALWQATLDAVDLVGEIIADEGIACDFRRKGHVVLAARRRHFARLAQTAAWFEAQLKYPLRLLSPQELADEVGTEAYHGGLLDDWGGSLHPAKYAYGLAAAAIRHGALVCEQTAVTRIEYQAHGFNVYTSQGTIRAREVIMATNGYTNGLVHKLHTAVFPAGSYAIVTEPLAPDVYRALIPGGRVFSNTRRSGQFFRLTPDGRLLFGAWSQWVLDADLVDSAKSLRRSLVRVFPQLADARVTHAWGGRLGMTFDELPHVGRAAGVHYALGYSGRGVALATYLGTELGLLLSGQKTDSPFVTLPHPKRFYYRKNPWFLPLVLRYAQLLDWVP